MRTSGRGAVDMGSEAPAPEGRGAASAGRWTVAVVIPARDEAALLPRCLASVLAAADHARHAADVLVVVLADRCVDETAAVAAQALAGTWASVVHTMAGNVGQARQLGCAAVRSICRSVPSDRLWIAMTDADTTVPTDWIVRQLAIAANGWDAVTGAIEIDDWSERSPMVARARGLHRDAQRRAGIPPIHGANLGIRASALDAVGGVPALALAEDVALVSRLHAAQLQVCVALDLVVRTSARRSERTPGGFSALLDGFEEQASA